MYNGNSYIDRSYYGTHNGSAEDMLRHIWPFFNSTTNRCITVKYIAYPERQSIYTPYGYRGSTTNSLRRVEPKLMG